MNSTIREEVSFWTQRACALLGACEIIVEYYGTDQEEELFRACVAPLLFVIDSLKQIAEGGEGRSLNEAPPASKFIGSEELAEMLSPLLRILVEWEPHFIATAREELGEQQCKRLVVPYGVFLGEANRCICSPLWTAYPRLAPEGWAA